MAITIWLIVQLSTLALAALRVRFWASAPSNSEQFALIMVLSVQIALAALMLPQLFRDRASATIVILTAWPLGELASFLAGQSLVRFAVAETNATMLLVAFYFWNGARRGSLSRMYSPVVAAMIAIGGVLLWYLRLEFGGAMTMNWTAAPLYGPLLGAISLLRPDGPTWQPWVFPAILLVFMFFASRISARSRRRIATLMQIGKNLHDSGIRKQTQIKSALPTRSSVPCHLQCNRRRRLYRLQKT